MKRILVVLALACALVAAVAGTAYGQAEAPYGDSTCLQCHGVGTSSIAFSKVDFSAAPGGVDFMKCRTCHFGTSTGMATPYEPVLPDWAPEFAGGAPHLHSGAISNCGDCHAEYQQWGYPFFEFVPRAWPEAGDTLATTPYGFFLTENSIVNPDLEALHAAHDGNGRIAQLLGGYENWDSKCAGCHSAASCNACHSDPVHGDHGGTPSCISAGCHVPEAPSASPSCLGCHPEAQDAFHEASHQSSTLIGCGGAGCHNTPDLVSVHTQFNADFACSTCHTFAYAVQISNGQTACVDCHTNMTSGSGHRSVHWASPPLADASGPRYSYWLGSVGTAPTRDCAMCHTSNLVDEHMGLVDPATGYPVFFPRKDSAGNALGCDSCHASADDGVQQAIANNLSSCESCHDVHGPIQIVHGSTFVDDPEVPCGDCHSADLAVEHNGTYSVTTPSGVKLVGCDVCHSYFEGERGAEVQAAISVTNDVRCSACHADYHQDTQAHKATSTASLACAECHGTVADGALDVTALHAGSAAGACMVCHSSPVTGKTAECASCHASEGTDYHKNLPGAHTDGAFDPSCASCHAADLPTEHEKFLGRYSEYASTCALCHRNADPSRIDWSTASASCASCHEVHGDIDEIHQAPDSQGCVDCHETADVRELHGLSAAESCAYCHAPGLAVPATAACVNCHASEGTDYHKNLPGAHTDGAFDPSCASCHAADLPTEHEKFLGRYSEYASTCALCHRNADASRIDWTTATASCASCHEVHGDIDEIHQAPASQGCVDCHETADVRELHGLSPAESCGYCHNSVVDTSGTAACVNCHGDLDPVDPNHYPADKHLAAETSCNKCHYLDLKSEHLKPTVAVSCVACHEVSVDAFTATWDKTCVACHPVKHGDQNAKHKSSNTSCTGSGCHDVTDVSVLHAGQASAPLGFADGFESGLGGWSTRTNWTQVSSPRRSGSYAARQSSTSQGTLQRSVSTKAGLPIDFRFWLLGTSSTVSTDWIKVEFKSNTGTWRTVWNKTLEDRVTTWREIALTIDEATYGPFGSNTEVRISARVSSSTKYQTIDDVSMTQTDIAVPYVGCDYCHKSASQPATTINCVDCHAAANPHHATIKLRLTTSSSTWVSACGTCHSRVHSWGSSCDRCHSPSGLHSVDSKHVDQNSDCAGCHTIAAADTSKNCLGCHKDLGSGSDSGGGWGGGGWGGGGWSR